ncbi:pilin, partial [Neisseria gonorrhoeae]
FSLFYSMSKYAVIPTKVGIWNARLEQAFYPISFRTDRPRFPPARE